MNYNNCNNIIGLFTMSTMLYLSVTSLLAAASLTTNSDIVAMTDSTLHLRMTAEELTRTFGNSKYVPQYRIIEPVIDERADGETEELQIHFSSAPDKQMRLRLRSKRHLVSSKLTVKTVDGSGSTTRRFMDPPSCLYHGTVEGATNSNVALSTCSPEEMTGVIHVSNEYYVLVPVPRRLRRRTDSTNEIGYDHILYRRQISSNESFCSLNASNAHDHTMEEQGTSDETIRERNRSRRQEDSIQKTIELAVFVDDAYYEVMSRHYPEDPEGAILDMVFTLVNAVQLIYSQDTLSVHINFVLVHVSILKSASEGPQKEGGEIKKYLKSFCAWQYDLNEPAEVGEHWDHALMLTGLDMYLGDPSNKVVIGLSWVSGMCHTKYSCSINEGTNFESVYVISHELGHNLGMQHDGLDNDCNNNSYLMSASLGPGKTTWSTCSDFYLRQYLNNEYASCMDNEVQPSEAIDYRSSRLPGQKYSASRQCHLSYGPRHKPYVLDKPPFDDICRELWCANGTVARRAHPALDGTTCYTDMVCFHGGCVPSNEVADQLKD